MIHLPKIPECQLNIRVPSKLRYDLRVAASELGMPTNRLVARICQEWLDRREEK